MAQLQEVILTHSEDPEAALRMLEEMVQQPAPQQLPQTQTSKEN